MPYSPDQLLKIAFNYEELSISSLTVIAKKKEKKLDPKAKVRNRGTVCVPAEQAKDKKDHFPINDEGQARNALARVQQLSSAPWYKGSLEGLKALVARKVKAKYPKIDVGGKKKEKKSCIELSTEMLAKYAQNYGDMSEYELAQLAQKGTDYGGNTTYPDFGITEEGIGTFKGEPWLRNLMNQGKITGKQYQAAANTLKMMEPPQHTPAPSTPVPTTSPGAGGIPYREDVWKAQRRLQRAPFNIPGLVADGKLGPQTRGALSKFKDYARTNYGTTSMDDEAAVAMLANMPEAAGGIVRESPF